MINVIATVTTKPGQRDRFLAEFQKLVPDVRAESGCVEYFPATEITTGIEIQRPASENCLWVIEKWESVEALRLHLAAPHMHAFRERTQDLVQDVSIIVAQPRA